MSNFETPIDDIFRVNGATGEYPSRPEPELPEAEDDRVGFKVWEVASVSKNRFDEKLAVEKIQSLYQIIDFSRVKVLRVYSTVRIKQR